MYVCMYTCRIVFDILAKEDISGESCCVSQFCGVTHHYSIVKKVLNTPQRDVFCYTKYNITLYNI